MNTNSQIIDLRSDTVTLPSGDMLESSVIDLLKQK